MQRKKIPRLRLKARIASKVREKDLMENAKLLAENPELILPDCAEDCGSCPFKKTRARLEKIQKHRDDPVKLAKFARRGDKLARAYAATIGLVHEEKTPYLATGTYPGGTITFALRGKTSKEKLIGVQNFDSPKWRVLSVVDLVKKKGLHFYSYGDNFVCTGKTAKPPEEYVKIAAESVGANKLENETCSCPHNPVGIDHIEFDWSSAGKKILVCDQCAIKSKNTLRKLAEGMAVPRVLDEFEISIVRPLKSIAGKGDCMRILNRPVSDELLDKYSSGAIGDKELIDSHLDEIGSALKEEKGEIFVRGNECFGDDMEAFVRAMTEDDVERKALVGLLEGIEHPVVVESGESVNKVLSAYWGSRGKEALRAVVSEALAEKYYEKEESARSPLKAIRQALEEAEHEAASSRIPKYSCLSQYAEFADEVARAYKTKGQRGAIAVLDGNASNDHRTRSMAHAFYLALGVTTKSWKLTDEEKAYGKHLEDSARRLLESTGPEEHHEAFEKFLKEAGCTEEIRRA
ncbi:MAG: hypothetical protein ACUVT7_08325 [Thermoplasmata archaeon]